MYHVLAAAGPYCLYRATCLLRDIAARQDWHGVSKHAHKVLISAALGPPSSCWHTGSAVLSSLQCMLQVKKRQSLRLMNFKDKNRVGCSVVKGSFDLTVQCRWKEKWEKVEELVWGLCVE